MKSIASFTNLSMASFSSSTRFIDAALSSGTCTFSLSYTDPDQKWLIRNHLSSLLQDYPSFAVYTDTFFHNDGNVVDLLKASGYLHLPYVAPSTSAPPVHLTIWIHENYPYMPPMVFISPDQNLHHNHPFVDSSCGKIFSPYLQTWLYPGCNLCDLIRNIVQIFSHDHPLVFSHGEYSSTFTHPTIVSKREGIDRLLGMIHYDMTALQTKNQAEIEELSKLQVELKGRNDIARCMVMGLEGERRMLKDKMVILTEETDVLTNWLKFNDLKLVDKGEGDDEVEDAFEAVDEDSRCMIDELAKDRGLEDVMYVLDKALEQGVVGLDLYIKQVRNIAREQFCHRDLLIKLRGRDLLI